MMKILSSHITYPLIEGAVHHSTFKRLKILEKTQWFPKEELKIFQEERLQSLIAWAYNEVPFWSRIFLEHSLRPANIKMITDLPKLPVLTRVDVKDNVSGLIAANYKGNVRASYTGGTTGEPVRLFRPKDDGWTWGAFYRGLGWYGFKPGDKKAIIWGGMPNDSLAHRSLLKIVSFLERGVSLSAFDLSDEKMSKFASMLKSFKPDIMIGYPSAVYIFAEYLRKHKILNIRPKVVVTSAEKLLEHQRHSIKEIFSCDVFEFYGCGEVLSLAYECPTHRGYHVSAEKVILEIVRDDGSPCNPGEKGRIVVTDLCNYAMPFIRYENGDVGALSTQDCSCGRSLPLLKVLEGRITDIITTKHGYISTPVLTLVFEKLPIRQYQVIQESEEKILIKVVRSVGYSEQDTQYILKTMRGHTGADMETKIEFVDDIPASESTGKRRVVISKFPQRFA
jgi:phenylacetate-CoA ligase